MDIPNEVRIVGEKGGPAGPFYSVIANSGRVVAMQIPEKEDARLIKDIPKMILFLKASRNALISYQHGNVSIELAKDVVEEMDLFFLEYKVDPLA